MDKPNATYANIVHNFLYFVYIFSYSLNTLNKIAVDKLNNKNNKIKILIIYLMLILKLYPNLLKLNLKLEKLFQLIETLLMLFLNILFFVYCNNSICKFPFYLLFHNIFNFIFSL